MADILSLRDKSLLALESTAFVRKFPDIHSELLSGLLQMREDVGRADARWFFVAFFRLSFIVIKFTNNYNPI